MTTTALQRIKEIESYFPILPGQAVLNRYKSNLGAISMNVASDIEFLLKAFNVMREIAVQQHQRNHMDLGYCPWDASPEQCVDNDFEKRMSK